MDNPGAALPGWCSASGRLSRSRQLKRSARRLSDVGLGTSGTGAERSWEYRFNPCENRLTPRQNAQQIPDDREVGTRPSFHHVSRVLVIDSDGDPLIVLPTPLSHEEIEDGFLNFRGQLVHHSTTMIRRRSLLEIGGYRPECCVAEDLDLFLRLAEIGRIANLAEPLLNYREHSSKSSIAQAEAFATKIFRIIQEARRRRGLEPAADSMM